MSIRPGCPVSINSVCDPNEIVNRFRDHFFIRSPLGSAAGDVGDT